MSAPPPASNLSGSRRRRRRRLAILLLVGLALVLAVSSRPLTHLAVTAWRDVDGVEALPPDEVDDASRLDRTHVAEVWPMPSDASTAEPLLAALLKRALASGLRVSIAGARHTMGGHAIYPDGILIDMLPFRGMTLDEKRNILHVESGARWRDVIAYLDPRGRSVAVMQSDNTFTVGGSLSANCHGWQFRQPPISSTVEGLRLMLADGTIVRCSRTENKELFSLVLGGYGLLGIILDVDLRVVPNERYRLEQHLVPVDRALSTFDAQVKDRPDVAMVYARMSIVPSKFLSEVILNVFSRDPAPDGSIPSLSAPGLVRLRRILFRGSAASNYGKELRWEAETRLQPHLTGKYFSRNQLLDEGVETFQNRSAESTDILHEYFVPAAGIAEFVEAVGEIVPGDGGDLLNVTVRSVEPDHDSLLRYADRRVFALVMLFNQPRTPAGEAQMQRMTRHLIDAALAAGGRYYLPYRLHATEDQFRRAYPQAQRFFELKRKYDPHELFQNQFYRKYGGGT